MAHFTSLPLDVKKIFYFRHFSPLALRDYLGKMIKSSTLQDKSIHSAIKKSIGISSAVDVTEKMRARHWCALAEDREVYHHRNRIAGKL
jgi:hypothetical protein